MILGPCPTCHERGLVYQAVRVTGRAKIVWGPHGHQLGIQRGREKHIPHSDAVRCDRCHHIRRDWQVWDGELVYQGE